MNQSNSLSQATGFGATTRKDAWWIEPTLVGLGFAAFIIYATFRACENQFFEFGPYLSPFYSPKFTFDWWHLSPAFLILWIPGGFRATCYYYRKAYYRAFLLIHRLVVLVILVAKNIVVRQHFLWSCKTYIVISFISLLLYWPFSGMTLSAHLYSTVASA